MRPVDKPGATSILHVLAIGSSSTAGTGASGPQFAYPAQLSRDLVSAWGIGADIENAGIGGERASATVDRLVVAMRTRWPRLVLWQVGTNDALSGADESQFRVMMQRGIEAVRRSQAELILIDPQYSPQVKDIARFERYVAIVGEIGAQDHVPVFSRYALMKAWGRQSGQFLSSMLAADGLHMSDRGYGCLAWRLAAEMTRVWGRSPVLASGDTTVRPALPVSPHAAADLHSPAVVKQGGAS